MYITLKKFKTLCFQAFSVVNSTHMDVCMHICTQRFYIIFLKLYLLFDNFTSVYMNMDCPHPYLRLTPSPSYYWKASASTSWVQTPYPAIIALASLLPMQWCLVNLLVSTHLKIMTAHPSPNVSVANSSVL